MKFVWCLGHHGNGRFKDVGYQSRWECLDCGAVMVKTGAEPDQEANWRLLEEVFDDPDQGVV